MTVWKEARKSDVQVRPNQVEARPGVKACEGVKECEGVGVCEGVEVCEVMAMCEVMAVFGGVEVCKKVWCGSIRQHGIVQRPIIVSESKGKREGMKLTTVMSAFECCLTILVSLDLLLACC